MLATCSARLPPPHSLQAMRCRTCSQSCCRRTPCNHCASSRARKCHFHRLPCTGCGSDRARSTTAAAALLAHAASPLVMTTADAFAAAVLAEVALPPVLGATTLVGLAAAPPVLAEAQSRPRQTRRTRRTRPNTQKHAFSVSFCLFSTCCTCLCMWYSIVNSKNKRILTRKHLARELRR